MSLNLITKLILLSSFFFLIFSREVVKIGAYDNPPKIFMGDDGKLTGFWYDITMKIAGDENWEVKWVYGSWDECLRRLEGNEIDIMVDTGVTPARQKIYLFNEETVYLSWTKIFKNKSADIQSVLDLEGKNIGGLKNSFDLEGPDGLKKILRDFQITANVSELNSYKEILSYIENGSLDAGIVDKDFGSDNENSYNIEPTPIVLQPARMQYALDKKSDRADFLKERIDQNMKTLKADNKSVYYTSLDNFFNKSKEKEYKFPLWLKAVLYSAGALIVFFIIASLIMRSEIKRKTRHLINEVISRERSESELKVSESKFRGLIEFAADGILLGSNDGYIIEANEAACEIFGMTREEIIGLHISKMPFKEESIKKNPLRFDLLQQGLTVSSERVIMRKDNSEVIIDMKTKMMSDKTYQSIYRDVTDRVNSENEIIKLNETLEESVKERTWELEQSNKELESFSYSVSHDLRAPLRHINGFAAEMEELCHNCGKEALAYLKKISDSALEMGALIDDLLEYSKTGRAELNKRYLDMNGLVNKIKERLLGEEKYKNAEVVKNELPEVFCDENLMSTVWINLIENAIKYSSKAKNPVIQIGYSDNNKEYEFFIKDNGAGFDPQFKGKIFGVFQRLHRKTEYDGTGIGLANVSRIIERHGGSVRAESEGEGKGACFYFVLPKKENRNERPA